MYKRSLVLFATFVLTCITACKADVPPHTKMATFLRDAYDNATVVVNERSKDEEMLIVETRVDGLSDEIERLTERVKRLEDSHR